MKAITGATMIDGTGGVPVQNATVVIDGDRITAAGPSGDVEIPSGTEIVDASGMHLLPGLIDCHDHLTYFRYELASRWRLTEPHSLWHMRIAGVLKQTLESGYRACLRSSTEGFDLVRSKRYRVSTASLIVVCRSTFSYAGIRVHHRSGRRRPGRWI